MPWLPTCLGRPPAAAKRKLPWRSEGIALVHHGLTPWGPVERG